MQALLFLGLLLLAPPPTFEILLHDGLLSLQRGDLAAANQQLSQAVTLNETSGLAWAALAQARWKTGESRAADEAAARAELVGAEQPNVLRALLLYWSGRGQQEPVIRIAKRALQQNDTAELHSLIGRAYLTTGRWEQAEPELRIAALARPINEQYAFEWGQALLGQQRFDQAAIAFESLAKELPESAQLHLGLGVARYGQRRFEQAAVSFLRTIELQPDVEQPYIFLGRMLDQTGEHLADVEKKVKSFLTEHPDSAAVNLVYAKLLLLGSEPKLDLVEKHLRQSIRQNKDLWEAHFELGALLARTRNFSDAADQLNIAVQLKPDEPAPHYHLARVYDRLGNLERAAAERAIHARLTQKPTSVGP